MVILLAQGDVDRCSLFTKEKRGAGRRGCCPPVFTQNFSDYLLLHTSARAIPLMFTRIMSLPLFPGLLLWIGNFFFYSRIFEVLPGRLSSKHRKEHWMSLWEKEEAISGFSLKKRLPSAATFSWGKWFPAIFPSGWEWLSLLPQDALLKKSQQFPVLQLWKGGRNSQAALIPPSLSASRPVLWSFGTRSSWWPTSVPSAWKTSGALTREGALRRCVDQILLCSWSRSISRHA